MRRSAIGEEFLDERPERARGVVDDMTEFDVVAVDVADHVDRFPGQRQLGREPRDLGERGVAVGKLPGQRPQRGQFALGRSIDRRIGHGASSLTTEKTNVRLSPSRMIELKSAPGNRPLFRIRSNDRVDYLPSAKI